MRKPEMPDALEFYLECMLRLYRDVAASCAIAASSQARDMEVIRKRTSSEGLSFLTKTLPKLGKCFDKALSSDGPFPAGHSFDCSKRVPSLPVFLGGFWKLIFDEDGRLLQPKEDIELDEFGQPIPSYDWRAKTQQLYTRVYMQVEAVRAVRQICFLLYKLHGAHSKESEGEVLSQFIETDRSLPQRGAELSLSATTERALENARTLVHWVMCKLDLHDIVPGHGPGAVATGEKPWEKMAFKRHFVLLDQEYPYSDYFFFNYTHLCDDLEVLERLATSQYGVAKVTLVPKDSRGPRLISMEPLENQWIQQGQMRALVEMLESHPCTAGYVNFTSQEINRELALTSSNGSSDFVTLDMKEASDRVSCWLVDALFPKHIADCLYASRSVATTLPNGELLELKKFAPMGSSTCFPVEAFIFWALAVGSLKSIRTSADLLSLPPVYVFGDDIVATRGCYEACRPVFKELFLEFNEDKCCTGRFFRESCGMDAFKCECVTPLRIKARHDNSSPAATLSYVSYVNSCGERGYGNLGAYLKAHVTRSFGSVPTSNKEGVSPLAFVEPSWTTEDVVTRLSNTFKTRTNKRLQREEVRVPVVLPREITHGEPNWWEMLRLKRSGSLQDPFGLKPEPPTPCCHTIPNVVNIGWAWRDLHSFVK